jgi:uncharacterized protein Smg (DUF494 family)
MTNIWDEIARQAAGAADDHYAGKISGLTRLNNDEIEQLIFETGISRQNLAEVLKEIKNSAKSNESKAHAISSISKGLDVLVAIAGKLL